MILFVNLTYWHKRDVSHKKFVFLKTNDISIIVFNFSLLFVVHSIISSQFGVWSRIWNWEKKIINNSSINHFWENNIERKKKKKSELWLFLDYKHISINVKWQVHCFLFHSEKANYKWQYITKKGKGKRGMGKSKNPISFFDWCRDRLNYSLYDGVVVIAYWLIFW